MKALIVDSDNQHTKALEQALSKHRFNVTSLDRPSAVTADFPAVDIAFISLDCAGEDGLTLMGHSALEGAADIVLMNHDDPADRVSEGIRAGASYFFTKPFDPEFISDLAADIAAEIDAQRQASDPVTVHHIDQFGLLRGSSPKMLKLYRIMRKIAQQNNSVFIAGESGVGKDLVAQSLHILGERSDAPFIALNCAAVPAELFESELFGHEKGSFSGAVSQHRGFFEQADGGTLFLDEITEMPLELQAKLLRVLDGNSFRSVGGHLDIEIDARILASTNRDPGAAIADGFLREDLYFRLANLVVRVPPLRARNGDAVGLAQHFLRELNEEYNTHKNLTDDATDLIVSYQWPGNVRELKSMIERAHILSEGANIEASDLSEITRGYRGSIEDDGTVVLDTDTTIAAAERTLVFAALQEHGGNKTRAAESLGISLKTLYNRLKEYEEE